LSLTLRGELRLRVFEKRVLRRVFGLKRKEGARRLEKITLWSFVTCTVHDTLFR
jgi:hypothetical protein